jgi:tetratricopeptide (TPR) repeat protein
MRHRLGQLVTFAALCGLSLSLVDSAYAQAQAQAQDTSAAPVDAAQSQEIARQHFNLGKLQYEGGAFRAAAASFERAYAQSKRELLWYNIYLAYRDAGDDVKSAEALRNYLSRVPEVDNRTQLQARLASLDEAIEQEAKRKREEEARQAEAAAAAAKAAEQAPVEVNPAATTAAPESPSSVVPFVLMGVGGAMIVGGLVAGSMSSSKYSELESKCPDGMCDRSLQPLADEGQTLALVADLLIFGGIAAAGTGGVWWFLNQSGSPDESASGAHATLACGLHTCGARIAGTF